MSTMFDMLSRVAAQAPIVVPATIIENAVDGLTVADLQTDGSFDVDKARADFTSGLALEASTNSAAAAGKLSWRARCAMYRQAGITVDAFESLWTDALETLSKLDYAPKALGNKKSRSKEYCGLKEPATAKDSKVKLVVSERLKGAQKWKTKRTATLDAESKVDILNAFVSAYAEARGIGVDLARAELVDACQQDDNDDLAADMAAEA